VKIDTTGFGRILAQTAKQVIIQRIREAERDTVFEEYKDRQGEIVNGIVRRFEKGAIIVDLGRAEAVLPLKEQVPRENYRPNDRVRAYVIEVNKNTKGSQIILSRTCMEMLTKLFEQEVPEIYEGIVTIQAASREPGGRSKIAVASRDSDVDPVGACVGMKGSRVQSVVQELRGERIDIVPWSPDPARYVCSALSPAAVSKVIIDDAEQSMDVIVPDDQLSLAIGRKGQNVRLAVQLTGWKIDIKSESKMRELARWLAEAVSVVEGCGDADAELLLQQGITSLEDLAACDTELLTQLPGIDEAGAAAIQVRATELAEQKRREDEEEAARLAAERAEAEAAAAAEASAPESSAEESR
jgi:N utilization substance protein A